MRKQVRSFEMNCGFQTETSINLYKMNEEVCITLVELHPTNKGL